MVSFVIESAVPRTLIKINRQFAYNPSHRRSFFKHQRDRCERSLPCTYPTAFQSNSTEQSNPKTDHPALILSTCLVDTYIRYFRVIRDLLKQGLFFCPSRMYLFLSCLGVIGASTASPKLNERALQRKIKAASNRHPVEWKRFYCQNWSSGNLRMLYPVFHGIFLNPVVHKACLAVATVLAGNPSAFGSPRWEIRPSRANLAFK
jgi:hypothetical protein